jgi:hypothetical protein
VKRLKKGPKTVPASFKEMALYNMLLIESLMDLHVRRKCRDDEMKVPRPWQQLSKEIRQLLQSTTNV